MKLAVYGPNRLGLVVGEKVVDMQWATAKFLSSQEGAARPLDEAETLVGHTLKDFLDGGEEALKTARRVIRFAKDDLDALRGERDQKIAFRIGGAKLRAPVTESSKFKIMCIGANFADHFVGLSRNSPVSMGGEKKVLT